MERESIWMVESEEHKPASMASSQESRALTKRQAEKADSKMVAALSNGQAICQYWNKWQVPGAMPAPDGSHLQSALPQWSRMWHAQPHGSGVQ